MRYRKDAVRRYVEMKAIDSQLDKDLKRLQTGYAVFLSYSIVDEELARAISNLLSELSVRHFFDRKDISWGEDVLKGVSEGLRGSTHLLVIVSPASVKSGWVAFEIGQASALGKTILPYLTHPSIDVPAFIRQYHYKTRLEEIRAYFEKPPLDQREVEELYQEVMSRLPRDLSKYSFCPEESEIGKDVWRSVSPARGFGIGGDGYSRIVVEDARGMPKVVIDGYRTWGKSEEAGWHDLILISYNQKDQWIESFDRCTNLEWDGKTSDNTCRWTASEAFWREIVRLLRDRLLREAGSGGSGLAPPSPPMQPTGSAGG